MSPNYIFEVIDQQLIKLGECPLSSVELILLQGIWQNLNYDEIGEQKGYSPGYLSKVAAPKLYDKLSILLGKSVAKKNCRALLETYAYASLEAKDCNSLSYPTGAIPLGSIFYVESPAIAQQAYKEINKPGALVRIKAPREMGKTFCASSVLVFPNNSGSNQNWINIGMKILVVRSAVAFTGVAICSKRLMYLSC